MSTYRPQSPNLSYAPQSPDLSGLNPPGVPFQQQTPQHYTPGSRFGAAFDGNGFGGDGGMGYAAPTSIPQQQLQQQWDYNYQQPGMMAMQPQQQRIKGEDDDEYMPNVGPAAKRSRQSAAQQQRAANGGLQAQQPLADPTLGVQLKTSFPVARIKRIMQHDEDIGKVAHVTPQVVSRALELFMVALISASARQARGGASARPGGAGGGGGSKSANKILAQHLKKAMLADQTFDFLQDIAEKVPEAPTKASAAKKEAHSDSEEEMVERKKPGKKKGAGKKARKDSGDEL